MDSNDGGKRLEQWCTEYTWKIKTERKRGRRDGARLIDHRFALVVKIEGVQGGGGVYEGGKVKREI